MSVIRRLFTFAGLALVGLTLAGCFDKEPEQRKAFIEFLQKRVIDRPGLKIPIVKDDEYKAMGPYGVHYGVMRRFHTALDESISKPLMQAVQAGKVTSLEELMKRRNDFAAIRDGMARLNAALDKAKTEADSDRAKLQQPKDVAVVYAAAYDKMVTKPADTIRAIMPPLQDMLQAGQELADYMHDNRTAITFRGSAVEAKDANVRHHLAELLKAIDHRSGELNRAQQKLRQLAGGR